MKLKLNYAVIWIKMKMFPPLSMCGPNMANLSCGKIWLKDIFKQKIIKQIICSENTLSIKARLQKNSLGDLITYQLVCFTRLLTMEKHMCCSYLLFFHSETSTVIYIPIYASHTLN
jgi:hypothetical protein